MLSRRQTRGFIGKYLQFLHINGCGSVKDSQHYARRLYSLEQFEHKKFFRPFKKRPAKFINSNAKAKDINPKVYMRNTIGNISNILRNSTWDSAQQQLENLSIQWDSYTINQVLKTHPPMEKAWLFFNWASRLKGFKHDQFTFTTMLDIFGEAGRISSMRYVFQQMQEKGINIDAVTYTSLLHWLSKDGDLEGSLKMWEEMKVKGCSPTVVSYTAFMKVLFDNNMPKEATNVYKEMLESGCAPNCYTYTVLMEYLVGSGKVTAALEILSKMQEAGVQPDKAACNILVQRCSRARETWAMTHILQYMKEHSIVLRYPVYREALETLKIAGKSDELLREVNPHLSFEVINNEETSQDKNIQLDSELISAIIRISCANYRPTSALLAFKYGAKVGINIERSACLALIGFFIRSNSISELVDIVEEMVAGQSILGTYLVSLLIYKLGCTRNYTSVERIFESLPNDHKNPATYTALMGAYFGSGNVEKGLEIFDTMKRKRIHSSSGTYRILIVGLEEAGRVHEAEAYKKEKRRLLGGAPSGETMSVEEGLCDLLFAGAVVS